MTPPHRRRRPCRAAAYAAVRWVPAVFGTALVVAVGRNRTSADDLMLPLVVVVAAVALAAYAGVRRRRRMTMRTTPGGGTAPTVVPLDELDRRAQRSLVGIDDCVRTSREELSSAATQLGDDAVRLYADAVDFAAAELAAAFRVRRRLDEGEGKTRELLEETLAHCAAAGRRLDAEAAGFDRTRALERTARDAVERAEGRFRKLAARVADADGTLAGLRERYVLSAYMPVVGQDERAKDRLLFATSGLNRARQALDRGETEAAVVQLRAAEAAVHQAAVIVDGIARLASDLTAATEALPAALLDTQAALEEARGQLGTEAARGDLRGRIAYGETVLAQVRGEAAGEDGTGAGEAAAPGAAAACGRDDPVDALRGIEQVSAGLDRALWREPDGPHVLGRLERALLAARSSVGAASDYVTTHRGAVGCEARTRLAEAEWRLRRAGNTEVPPVPAPPVALTDAREADALARQARQLAERDVRAYGTPYGVGIGTGGAVLGGILLDAPRRPGERAGHPGDGGPACYGGPGTRGRRDGGELFRPSREGSAGPSPPRTGSATPPPDP
ncbi:TPM domain-containing protein [Streptomyces caeni]|uniref:TPM domain-containing protein n=1 Tax=Streptomyces caeni TaxID=2307231 RepID=A0ABW4IS86_9ACTN